MISCSLLELTRQKPLLLNCLNLYSSWSGQSNNPFKSTISFSKNTKPESISSIQAILNLRQISPNAKYIGLPLFIQENKKAAFEDIISKILQKITGWKAKLLSQAAKTTLIKSVDYSIPSFSMYIFLLPKSLCRGIDASIRKFWWGFNPSKRHNLTLLAWNKISSPKSVGGLGICTMEYQNSFSLLSKLGWKILNQDHLLWVKALSIEYIRSGNFLEVPIIPNYSWLWKGMLTNRQLLRKELVGLSQMGIT